MASEENYKIRRIKVKPGESLKSIYAKVRRRFTAADLQRYTEIEEGIPARQVLAELETIHREITLKRRKAMKAKKVRKAKKA